MRCGKRSRIDQLYKQALIEKPKSSHLKHWGWISDDLFTSGWSPLTWMIGQSTAFAKSLLYLPELEQIPISTHEYDLIQDGMLKHTEPDWRAWWNQVGCLWSNGQCRRLRSWAVWTAEMFRAPLRQKIMLFKSSRSLRFGCWIFINNSLAGEGSVAVDQQGGYFRAILRGICCVEAVSWKHLFRSRFAEHQWIHCLWLNSVTFRVYIQS